MTRKLHHLALAALFLSGCASKNPLWSRPTQAEIQASDEAARPKTQLEVREMQTRTFSAAQSAQVMKALLNVLQDDGFVVKNAVLELGLLSASKEVDVANTGQAILNSVLFGIHARWNKNSIIESTANVTQTGKDSKVRVTFQVKTLNNRGEVSDVRALEDAKYYQEFFAKVDKGIYIQNEGL